MSKKKSEANNIAVITEGSTTPTITEESSVSDEGFTGLSDSNPIIPLSLSPLPETNPVTPQPAVPVEPDTEDDITDDDTDEVIAYPTILDDYFSLKNSVDCIIKTAGGMSRDDSWKGCRKRLKLSYKHLSLILRRMERQPEVLERIFG